MILIKCPHLPSAKKDAVMEWDVRSPNSPKMREYVPEYNVHKI